MNPGRAGVLSECQDQPIAVFDYELTLTVGSVFGTIDDVGTARAQLVRQTGR